MTTTLSRRPMPDAPSHRCACGCGITVPEGCRYVHGHRDTWAAIVRRQGAWLRSEEGQRAIREFAKVYPGPAS